MKKVIFRTFLLGMLSLLGISAWATPDYLCFTANEDNVELWLEKHGTPTAVKIQYSTDGCTSWTTVDFATATKTGTINLDKGEKVYFRNASDGVTKFSTSSSNFYWFRMWGSISASGNLMSLVDKSCTTKTIPCEYCFYGLFTSCVDLTTPPELPATTLANYCYSELFYKCPHLEYAPELPATTLVEGCYNTMFPGSPLVSYIKVGFTEWAADDEYATDWWAGFASRGIFVCPETLPKEYGRNRIPEGWSVNCYDLGISSTCGWASMYLPCAVSIPEGVEAYYASAVNGGKITLKKVEGNKLAPKTAVIVKSSGNVKFTLLDEEVAPISGNLFQGEVGDVVKNSKIPYDEKCYVLNPSTSTPASPVFSEYTGYMLDALKVYLTESALGSSVKQISFEFEDEATSIDRVDVQQSAVGNPQPSYNLSGMRVNSNYKGIVVENGKKVLKK